MTQLTPRDDVRKAASEILKRVDQLIRAGEIDHSIREIIHAKEIDPANVYVRAYEERLAYLKEEHEKNAEREKTRQETERAAREKDEALRKRQEEEQKRQIEEQHRLEQERRQEQERKQERERKQEQERIPPPPVTSRSQDIKPTEPDRVLENTPEYVYIKTFKKAWSEGNVTAQRATSLEQLGKELGVSAERQHQLEKNLYAEPRAESQPSTILIIDDDENLLSAFAGMLTGHGYEVVALTTSDEAYTLLKKWKPELIVCDVNLETSTMGGFSFYEKIRLLEHLRQVPFIFLTGLSDEVLIRTGKELGVDDYLTKPISEQNLVAAIKGKIKRFRELKGKS